MRTVGDIACVRIRPDNTDVIHHAKVDMFLGAFKWECVVGWPEVQLHPCESLVHATLQYLMPQSPL